MKTRWIWIVSLAWAATVAMGAEGDLEKLQALVENAKPYVAFCRNDAEILVDNLRWCSRKPELRALQGELEKSWRFALAHLDELAPDDATKALVLGSCWFIDEREFGSYLLEMVRLVEEGKLNPRGFMLCQAPVGSPLEGAIRRNRSNPEVREALEKAREIFRDDGMLQRAYGNLLEEKPKENHEASDMGISGQTTFVSVTQTWQRTTVLPDDETPPPTAETTGKRAFPMGSWPLMVIGCLMLSVAVGTRLRSRKKE